MTGTAAERGTPWKMPQPLPQDAQDELDEDLRWRNVPLPKDLPKRIDKQANNNTLHPADITRIEVEHYLIALRKHGMSYRGIATRIGWIDKHGRPLAGTVHKFISRGLQRWTGENADDLRAIEMERLDDITARLWPIINKHESPRDDDRALRAIDRYMQISERRAKLSGLDAPERKQLDVHASGEVRVEVVEQVAEYLKLIDTVATEIGSGDQAALPPAEPIGPEPDVPIEVEAQDAEAQDTDAEDAA